MLISNAYAIEVTEISQGLENNTAEITSLKAELNAKLEQVNVKLDTFATNESMTNLLNQHLNATNSLMDNFRSMLIVSTIIIGLCLIGLAYAIFFYFKGKRRL